MGDTHLIFLVHGLFGNATHMASMAEQLRQELGHDKQIVVYCPTGNESVSTFDGVEKGAGRLFKDLFKKLLELAEEGRSVTKFSVVGYSLGGLYARYLIGLLYECGFFDNVEPVVFATFASPHAGTYFHSQDLRARILNFFGTRLLGFSGHDLFSANDVLHDLADPEQCYFKGLKLFKKLFLFANTIHDRTVPFWTSYLSTKNPFQQIGHTDLVFYDQSLLKSTTPDSKYPKSTKPFLVAMGQSKYSAEPRESHPLSGSACRTKIIYISALPVLLPVMMNALTTMTAVTYVRSYLQQHSEVNHRKLMAELDHKYATLDQTSNQRKSRRSRRRSISEVAQNDSTSAAGNVVENMLQLADDTEGVDVDTPLLDGYPEPAVNGGFGGLVDSMPFELGITKETRQIIDNLNTLPWNKYAVLLNFLNSHGEIVNRRKANGQGNALQVFFGRLVAQTLRDLEPIA